MRFYTGKFLIFVYALVNVAHCFDGCIFHRATNDKKAYLDCEQDPDEVKQIWMSFLSSEIGELNSTLLSPFKNAIGISISSEDLLHIQPKAFENLNLNVLQLRYNKIKTVDKITFFGQNKLNKLDLAYNSLKTITEGTFEETPNLKELYLQGNRIKIIDRNGFNFLSELKHLNLSVNSIENLDKDVFKSLKELQVLDLRGNYLSFLPTQLFYNLKHLTSLNLQYNQIKIFADKIFNALEKLNDLDISNNQIVQLQTQLFYKINELRVLKFSSNNINHFDHMVNLIYLPKLTEIDLRDNLLRCEDLKKILEALEQNKIQVINPTPIKTEPNIQGLTCYDLATK